MGTLPMWIPVYCPKEEKVKGVQGQVDSGEQEGLPVRKAPRDSSVRVSEILTGSGDRNGKTLESRLHLGPWGFTQGTDLALIELVRYSHSYDQGRLQKISSSS